MAMSRHLLPLILSLTVWCVERSSAFNYSFSGLDWPGRCQTGLHQSPINIVRMDARPTPHSLTVDYQVSQGFIVENSGFNLHVKPPAGSKNILTYNSKPYNLLQVHSHVVSEHSFEGFFGAMELHYVHSAVEDPKELLVLATVLRLHPRNVDNTFFASWRLGQAPRVQNRSINIASPIDFADSFIIRPLTADGQEAKVKATVYTYSGSLTTPPSCQEGVTWLILDPSHGPFVSVRQLEQFQLFISREMGGDADNDRLPQPLDGRKVGFFRAVV